MCRKLLISISVISIISSLYSFGQSCIIIDEQPPQDEVIILNNDVVLTNNTSTELSVSASGSSTLLFQWQLFNDTLGIWENISESSEFTGTLTSNLTITNVNSINDGDRIRVLISSNEIGCNPLPSEETTITKASVKVNNFFTPNGDGFNDTFTIEGISNPIFEGNELNVFNRWGNTVFKEENYQNDWDGTPNSSFSFSASKKVPAGTYFYTLDLNFKNVKLSGWVYVKL